MIERFSGKVLVINEYLGGFQVFRVQPRASNRSYVKNAVNHAQTV